MISIVVPVYKGEKYVAACLDAITAQTYSDWEVVVVIDGIFDGSEAIAGEYAKHDSRFQVFTQDNSGVSVARNEGFKRSRTDYPYVLFLDHDDLLEPNALEVLKSVLDEHPEDPAVCGRCTIIDGSSNAVNSGGFFETWARRRDFINGRLVFVPAEGPITFGQLSFHNYLTTTGAVMIRKESVRSVGGFTPGWRTAQDWDFFWRLTKTAGNIITTQEQVIRYRRHDLNTTSNSKNMRVGIYRFQRNLVSTPGLTPEQRRTARLAYFYHEWVKGGYAVEFAKRKRWGKAVHSVLGMLKGILRFMADILRGKQPAPDGPSTS